MMGFLQEALTHADFLEGFVMIFGLVAPVIGALVMYFGVQKGQKADRLACQAKKDELASYGFARVAPGHTTPTTPAAPDSRDDHTLRV